MSKLKNGIGINFDILYRIGKLSARREITRKVLSRLRQKDSSTASRSNKRVPQTSCETIESVYQDKFSQYHCKSVNGNEFACNKIVEQPGELLEGVVVKVTVPYVDGCHIPGGCGGHACVPSYGTASLDLLCQLPSGS